MLPHWLCCLPTALWCEQGNLLAVTKGYLLFSVASLSKYPMRDVLGTHVITSMAVMYTAFAVAKQQLPHVVEAEQ